MPLTWGIRTAGWLSPDHRILLFSLSSHLEPATLPGTTTVSCALTPHRIRQAVGSQTGRRVKHQPESANCYPVIREPGLGLAVGQSQVPIARPECHQERDPAGASVKSVQQVSGRASAVDARNDALT